MSDQQPTVTREDREAALNRVVARRRTSHSYAQFVETERHWAETGEPMSCHDEGMYADAEHFARHRETSVRAERDRVAAILHDYDSGDRPYERASGGLPFDVHAEIVGDVSDGLPKRIA